MSRGLQGAQEDGSAVVEFVLVGALLLFVALGVAQLALVLHTRNVLAADAAEGARHAANLGLSEASGGPYAAALVRDSIPGAGPSLQCGGHGEAGPGNVRLAVVTCGGQLRLALIPLGPHVSLSVSGRAVKETGP